MPAPCALSPKEVRGRRADVSCEGGRFGVWAWGAVDPDARTGWVHGAPGGSAGSGPQAPSPAGWLESASCSAALTSHAVPEG